MIDVFGNRTDMQAAVHTGHNRVGGGQEKVKVVI